MPQHAKRPDESVDATQYFYIQHVQTGLFLMPYESMTAAGTHMVTARLQTDQLYVDSQLWTRTSSGMIMNKASGLVLQAAGGPGSMIVQQRAADDRPKSQLWDYHVHTQLLTSKHGDRLALTGGLGGPFGAYATMEHRLQPAPLPRQQWRLVQSAVPEPYQFFVEAVRADGTRVGVLTPAAGRLTQGTRLAVEPESFDYQEKQLWSWAGSGQLVNVASSMVADVYGNVPTGNVVLHAAKPSDAPDGTKNQTWALTANGRIRSDLGNWALAMENPNIGSTTKLVPLGSKEDTLQWRVRRAVYPEPVTTARAVDLNGTDQALALGQTAGPRLKDFTAEAWVRTKAGGPVITSRGVTTDSTALALVVQGDGSLVLQVTGGTAPNSGYYTASITTGPTNATDGEWHHLAGCRNGDDLALYLDGVAVDPVSTITPSIPLDYPPQQQLQFGAIRYENDITRQLWLDGSLAEVRLWNRARTEVEIPAGMHHQIDDHDLSLMGHWTFADDSGRDSSLAGRTASFQGAPGFSDSGIEVVPQGDFYLVTQARLIQDYQHNANGTSAPKEITGYRVTINLRDANDMGTPGFLTLQLNNPDVDEQAVLHFPDATAVTLNAKQPLATLTTDSQGVLTFTLDADDKLLCPLLRVQADFQNDGSWLLIAPDRQAHAALAAISGDNLRGRDDQGNKIPDKTAPLPDTVTAGQADAAASAITQLMSTATQHSAQGDQQQVRLLTGLAPLPITRPYLPRYQLAGIVATGHDPITDAIATHHIDRDAPVARILETSNAEHAHWSFDFAAKTFTPHTPQQAARVLESMGPKRQARGDLAKKLLKNFGPGDITGTTLQKVTAAKYAAATEHDILTTTGTTGASSVFSWVRDHVKEAEHLLVNQVKLLVTNPMGFEQEVEHLVLTVVNKAKEVFYAVIQAVDHALEAVAGVLEKLGSDIKKIVQFLKDLFNWQDVRNTQRIMHTYFNNLIYTGKKDQPAFIPQVLRGALAIGAEGLESLKQAVDQRIDEWREHLVEAGTQHKLHDSATAPPQNVKSGYVQHMTSSTFQSASQSQSGSQVHASGWSGLDTSVVEGTAIALGEKWLTAVGKTWESLPQQILNSPLGAVHDVKSLLLDGVEILLNTLEALIDALINSVVDLIEGLEQLLEDIFEGLYKIGNQELHIPILTPFYEKIVMGNNGEKLCGLGLMCLLDAMPVTFVYKLLNDGKAPYTTQETEAFVRLLPTQYTWLKNPFAPTASRTGDPPISNVALDAIAMGGVIVLGIGATASDICYSRETVGPAVGSFLGNQWRYKWGVRTHPGWQKFFTLLVVAGNFAVMVGTVLALVNAAKSNSGQEKSLAAVGFLLAFVVTGSSLVGAVASQTWSFGDATVQTLAAIGSLGPVIATYVLSEHTYRDKLTIAAGTLSFFSNVFQFLKIPMSLAPTATSSKVMGVVVTAADVIGYFGTFMAECALLEDSRTNPKLVAQQYLDRYMPSHALPEFD
ncbi:MULTISPECIES: LamG-like jellyroll fold domain-containing protein [unclassified Streptomyces]|uniref:LamG-like jellyroll fold domain-containing protein n=1 Tax=unclassified Streptomyces TaxID=2593676 RepID=UPI003450E91C